MLCPIKQPGLERCGSTALGDLSCEMKAVTSDLLLTNEKEGPVIYGINGQIILCFWTEMLLCIPPCSSPNAQHQLSISLHSPYYINPPGHPVTNNHTHTHTHTHIHTCDRNECYNPPTTAQTMYWAFQSFLGISPRSYVTAPSSPDRMQHHKRTVGSEAVLKRQLLINT